MSTGFLYIFFTVTFLAISKVPNTLPAVNKHLLHLRMNNLIIYKIWIYDSLLYFRLYSLCLPLFFHILKIQ